MLLFEYCLLLGMCGLTGLSTMRCARTLGYLCLGSRVVFSTLCRLFVCLRRLVLIAVLVVLADQAAVHA